MRYRYEFKKDPFDITRIVLPEKISIFSDFIEDISTEVEMDEYIDYIKKVLEGMFENFEITLNAVSVDIKKETTIATHHYKNDEPFENTIETEELLKLMLLWKEQITDDV